MPGLRGRLMALLLVVLALSGGGVALATGVELPGGDSVHYALSWLGAGSGEAETVTEAHPPTPPPEVEPAAIPVERFPALHVPPRPEVGRSFPVSFRLTMAAEVETIAASEVGARGRRGAVAVEDERLAPSGALGLDLPGAGGPWELRAVLGLEDLALTGADPTAERRMVVPVDGDSDSVRWEVVAPALPSDRLARVEVSLFMGSRYLGRVFRDIRIGAGSAGEERRPRAFELHEAGGEFHVHLEVKTRIEDGEPVVSLRATTSRATYSAPDRVDSDRERRERWLAEQYLRLGTAGRALDAGPAAGEDAPALLRGMGHRLWDTYVPRAIQEALCEGFTLAKPERPVVEIYTDDPAFPWELVMVSCPRAGGSVEELGPLAVVARVAR